ncbi:MAG: PKD domain-containing protein, partial [Thermoplasmata archaeon]
PMEVIFDASSSAGSQYDGAIFSWNFGDDPNESIQTDSPIIVHTYNTYGAYDVSLTITTDCGSHTLTLYDLIKIKSSQPTREVGEEGSGYAYTSIQEAIDDINANYGEVILVHDGTYYENIIFKGKRVTVCSKNGASSTIIDGSASGSVVTFNSHEDEDSVLDGLTIQNGKASYGGGIYCTSSSPSIINCKIIGNTADRYGGGVYCSYSNFLTIANCEISDNVARYGGGIYTSYSLPYITNCIINGNTTDQDGGGSHSDHGSLINTNCTFNGNSAGDDGGAIRNSSSSSTIINCTFYGNSAGDDGGAIRNFSSTSTIKNCILWGDTPDEICYSGFSVTYSDIQGGYCDPNITQNINEDPLFVDPNAGDLHLQCNSPCIDKGTGNDAPSTDIDGNPRPLGEGYDIGAYEMLCTGLATLTVVFEENEYSVYFGISEDGDREECSDSDKLNLGFKDPDASLDPNIFYCKDQRALELIPTRYHWVFQVELEEYSDSNNYPYLTWNSNLLRYIPEYIARVVPEYKWYGWILVKGEDKDGEELNPDMTKVKFYQIKEGDGEYFSIVFKEIDNYPLDLRSGWNLISLPMTPENPSRQTIFPEAIAVYYYDPVERIYIYVEETDEMKPGLGYWILDDQEKICKIYGDPVTHYSSSEHLDGLQLYNGWNMIGALSGATTISLSSGEIRAVYEFDPNDGYDQPQSVDIHSNSAQYLEQGKGYWILPSEESILYGEVEQGSLVRSRTGEFSKVRFRSGGPLKMKITTIGQERVNCANKSKVALGISDTASQIPSLPFPPCTTILSSIYDLSDRSEYISDIRTEGPEIQTWVLRVKNKPNSGSGYYPLLKWELTSLLNGSSVELRKGA